MMNKEQLQLCVLRGVTDKLADLERLLPETFPNTRISVLDSYYTLAGNGGDGGRRDVLFGIHPEDVNPFAIQRLEFGISWWEDALDNESSLIPSAVKDKYPRKW